MPETAKVNGPEEASSKTDEPGLGAKKADRPLIESSASEKEAAAANSEEVSENLEGSNPPHPDTPEERSTPASDGGAGDGPADPAGAQEKDVPNEGEDSSAPETEEGFFSGWDGLDDDIHELSADEALAADDEEEAQPFEGEAGHRSLAQIALASGTLHALDASSDAGSDLASKHDELADAVQAALMSVYGDASSGVPGRKALPFSPEPQASGLGWASEDNLSPQDVILNYFDYQPGSGKGRGQFSGYRDAGYEGKGPGVIGQPHEYPQYWSGQAASHAAYDDFPPYPESLASSNGAEDDERERGRLLGAAAIGLVGGIAIAASLAVFVISSYGPGGRPLPGVTQTADASQTGYGRWVKGGVELETSKAAAAPSSPEAAPVIAASDVQVTPSQPSPLAIEVKPEQSNERSLISITGIPEGARLNAGVDAGGGNWLLPPRRLTGLTISVPAGTPDTVLLGVQVLDGNVRTPLSEKKQFSIRVNTAKTEPAPLPAALPRTQPDSAALQRTPPEPAPALETPKPAKPASSFFSTETVPVPAPAPASAIAPQAKPASASVAQQPVPSRPAAQAAGAPSDQTKVASRTEIEDLIREGNKRMREGDILDARQLYQKAVALGDPEAALAMGRSYDPVYFARIDKKNAEPDAAKAFDWYRKAMDGGAAPTAKVRIENLKHFLNQ